MVHWVSKEIQAINANQAEARAVLEGYKLLMHYAEGFGTVLSDSVETVASLRGGLPILYDWRSYEEIWSAWRLQADAMTGLKTMHCSRNEEGLKIAHTLANQGRIYSWNKTGNTNPVFQIQQLE